MRIISNIGAYGLQDSNNRPYKKKEIKNQNRTSGNYDEISISKDSATASDKVFMQNCANRIKAQVRQPVSDEKIDEIKNRISNHSYVVDYSMLASKIMREL